MNLNTYSIQLIIDSMFIAGGVFFSALFCRAFPFSAEYAPIVFFSWQYIPEDMVDEMILETPFLVLIL